MATEHTSRRAIQPISKDIYLVPFSISHVLQRAVLCLSTQLGAVVATWSSFQSSIYRGAPAPTSRFSLVGEQFRTIPYDPANNSKAAASQR